MDMYGSFGRVDGWVNRSVIDMIRERMLVKNEIITIDEILTEGKITSVIVRSEDINRVNYRKAKMSKESNNDPRHLGENKLAE